MRVSRRLVSESEAVELVSAWQRSQMPLDDWCADRGIDGRSLRPWVDRSLDAAGPTIRLMEMSVPCGKDPIRVTLEDVTIEIPDGFASETLARVLMVVREC